MHLARFGNRFVPFPRETVYNKTVQASKPCTVDDQQNKYIRRLRPTIRRNIWEGVDCNHKSPKWHVLVAPSCQLSGEVVFGFKSLQLKVAVFANGRYRRWRNNLPWFLLLSFAKEQWKHKIPTSDSFSCLFCMRLKLPVLRPQIDWESRQKPIYSESL